MATYNPNPPRNQAPGCLIPLLLALLVAAGLSWWWFWPIHRPLFEPTPKTRP